MNTQTRVDVEEVLGQMPVGGYRIAVFALAVLLAMLDGIDNVTLGLVAPADLQGAAAGDVATGVGGLRPGAARGQDQDGRESGCGRAQGRGDEEGTLMFHGSEG